jgi:hypothetical protein
MYVLNFVSADKIGAHTLRHILNFVNVDKIGDSQKLICMICIHLCIAERVKKELNQT